jgi:WD40 repeat protein
MALLAPGEGQQHAAEDEGACSLIPGQELSGDAAGIGYRLVRRLARGGFGEVWEAAGPGGFPVALKLLELANRAGKVERDALELIKGIRHPHLLAVFGAWQTGQWLVIASELADRTLAHCLHAAQERGKEGILVEELLAYLREAAEGLEALHAADIQHRDVKPSNLLLVGGSVKVGDYGLAKILADGNTAHSGAMTPAYAAPEFFAGRTSSQSDQYSLAASYCQLRGGRLPFTGTPLELMKAHSEAEPDLSMLPGVEGAVVARALAKDPGKRWPGCRAFVEALAGAVSVHEGPLLNPNGKGTPKASAARRLRWGLASALLLTGIALLIVCALTLPHLLRQSDRTPSSSATSTPEQILVDQPRQGSDRTELLPVASPDQARPVRELAILRGHLDAVTRVAFAGGGRAVSASDDQTVRIWDLKSGQEVYCLRGHKDEVTSVAATSDGRWVVSGGGLRDPTICLWDLKDGKQVACLKGHEHTVRCLAFLPDEQQVLSGGYDHTIRLWSLPDKKEVWSVKLKGHVPGLPTEWTSQVWSMDLLPGGERLLVGLRDGVMCTVDVGRGKVLHRLIVHRSYINWLAVSPDGNSFLTANGEEVFPRNGPHDDTVRLWETANGHLLKSYDHLRGFNFCIAFLPDGKRALAAGTAGTILLWEPTSGKELGRLAGHQGKVWAVAVSPDGRTALSCGEDRTVRWWPLPEVP